MGHKILSVFVCRKNSYRGGEIGKSVYENFKKTEIGGKNVNKDFTEIVRAALSGDEAAFEALYTMTKDSAYFIALSLTHNEQDALDILQDSYIKAFTHLGELNSPELFDSWLKRIVANCSKNFLKVKKPMLFSDIPEGITVTETDEETDSDLIPHEFVDKKEASRLIMEIINKLPENKRLVILMYYYQNMQTKEIAEELGLPLTTVKYYLLEARKEIRTELEKLDKKGTRLYAVLPFALLPSLMEQAAESVTAPKFSAVSSAVMSGVNSGTAEITPSAAAGKGGFLKTAAFKITAAVAAVAIIGGGIAAAVIVSGNNKPQTVQTSQTSDKDNTNSDNTESDADTSDNTESSTESEAPHDPADDYEYVINNSGVILTKYTGTDREIVIPDTIEGKPVVRIGNTVNGEDTFGTFQNNFGIVSIVIPDSVTAIDDNAFSSCKKLSEITIPDSVLKIGSSAFHSCEALKSISIPKSVTQMGSSVFSECTRLTNITLPDSITKIDDSTFSGCVALKSIDIPGSVTEIGMEAFYGCTELAEINIPDSVTNIHRRAFDNTAWYNSQPDGLTYAGKVAYYYKGEMPENTSIELKADTKGIAEQAFNDRCRGLTNITIPDSVEYVGFLALEYTAWYNSQPDGLLYIGKIAYRYKGDIPDNTNLVIREGTETIGEQAFAFGKDVCMGLTSIEIPESVKYIGDNVFEGCWSLESVTIPKSVNKISYKAFYDCRLTEINVDENNPYYSSENGVLFSKDKSTLIRFPKEKKGKYTVPDSVTEIGNYAFSNCMETEIVIPDNVTDIAGNAFDSDPIYVVHDLKIHCSSGGYAEKYANNHSIPTIEAGTGNAMGSCGDNASWVFDNNSGKLTIKGSGSINVNSDKLPDYPDKPAYLRYAKDIKSVDISSGITEICEMSFWNCYGLENINIPESVTTITDPVFINPDSITIHGKKGSYAEEYAKEESIKFAAE